MRCTTLQIVQKGRGSYWKRSIKKLFLKILQYSQKPIIIKPNQKKGGAIADSSSQRACWWYEAIKSNAKRRRTQIEFEREIDRAFQEFRKTDAEKNRNNELEMTSIGEFSPLLTLFRPAHPAGERQIYPALHVQQNFTQTSTKIQPSLTEQSNSTSPVSLVSCHRLMEGLISIHVVFHITGTGTNRSEKITKKIHKYKKHFFF